MAARGFEFLCNATDCEHNDAPGGCFIHTMTNPIVLKEGGLCEKYDEKLKHEPK